MDLVLEQRAKLIREFAQDLGFDDVGFVSAEPMQKESDFLEQWLEKGYHAGMDYMERNFEKRTNPAKLVEGAKSVVVCLQNYAPSRKEKPSGDYKISKYAYGRDYHKVVKNRLKKLFTFIQSEVDPQADGRFFVDSAPVSERALAASAGLGWRGKNTNLIHPRLGSFIFIGEIILNIDLPSGSPIKEACGGCTRCIEACPTDALRSPYELDSNRCISYLTIENKGSISAEFAGKMEDWIFGCDICQDVCPWNWKARPHSEPDFKLWPVFKNMENQSWEELDAGCFDEISRGSPIRRAGFDGIKRNISFVVNAKDPDN
ncbi:tRNA epoxyqueuosine(34) reductase QueG [Marinilabilia rubra]|uniref:Epoxyqueuosine reductase n=1 Tax=Marinilabilia rubra TaxID=2162893 RepID=A0A2U2B816_9BACT|nr:tRNA epoxyqueuosine(34) reductase QueG [Marinilabilia rubra]PWD99208.1 tRNA epoxyqueuosine(34) reductase QueG [Marinilabilia rubra]